MEEMLQILPEEFRLVHALAHPNGRLGLLALLAQDRNF